MTTMTMSQPDKREMTVSPLRLYVMRAMYLLIAVGLAIMIWPLLLLATPEVEHMRGVVWSLLGAVGLLAVLGIRYPLQMLPLLLFELVWKTIWILAIGLPLRLAGELEGGNAQTWIDCVSGVVLCLVAIPWGYVFDRYVRRAGDPWRLRRASGSVQDPGLQSS
jgi:hypothetical protein